MCGNRFDCRQLNAQLTINLKERTVSQLPGLRSITVRRLVCAFVLWWCN